MQSGLSSVDSWWPFWVLAIIVAVLLFTASDRDRDRLVTLQAHQNVRVCEGKDQPYLIYDGQACK